MALRLASGEQDLVVHDVMPEPVAELVAAGATAAAKVAELAGQVDVLCVMVRDDDQVRDVLGQAVGAMKPGSVFVVHSTIAPLTPRQLEGPRPARRARPGRRGQRWPDGRHRGDAGDHVRRVRGGVRRGAAGARADGHQGPARRPDRRRDPDEAGAEHDALHCLHGRDRGARLAEAAGLDLVELGNVVRHTDAVTGGPGAIMHRDTTAPLDEDDFWHGVFTHVGRWGRRTSGSPSSSRTSWV